VSATSALDQAARSDEGFRYYCDDPPGYYPAVTTCPSPFRKVSVSDLPPEPAPPSAPFAKEDMPVSIGKSVVGYIISTTHGESISVGPKTRFAVKEILKKLYEVAGDLRHIGDFGIVTSQLIQSLDESHGKSNDRQSWARGKEISYVTAS